MSTIAATIKRRSVLAYMSLVIGISWGAFLIVVGPIGTPGTPDEIGRLIGPVSC